MKIVFFGTPSFSLPFLKTLIDDKGIEVIAVVCQSDKPSGRGGEMKAAPVKLLATESNIPVLTPTSLKNDPLIANELAMLKADLFVVVAYGKIIPRDILDLPTHGCINVHPSTLPKHRGPSPMQWAIAEGDLQTSVSIMLLDEGMDTGPILAGETIMIDDNETYSSLVKKVHVQGPGLLVETIKRHVAGEIVPIEQDDSKATLTRLLKREDGHVDWSESMEAIDRKLRAYEQWPGLWFIWKRSDDQSLRIKILAMRPTDFRADVPPGTVVIKDGKLHVDTSDGTLEILDLQPEGKLKMNAQAFLSGYPDIDGALLS